MVRHLGLFVPLLAVAASLIACGSADSTEGTSTGGRVTNIPTSSVIDQGETGNCWLYATAAWAESLHATATGDTSVHFSPAYWDYWDWYNQILAGATEVEFGGFWGRAINIVHNYGMAPLGAFANGDDAVAAVAAQQAINQKLAAGLLSNDSGTIDPAAVRAALDDAFQLSDDKKALLTSTFGADGSTTFANGAAASGFLVRAQDFQVTAFTATGKTNAMLDDLIGTQSDPNWEDERSGTLAWSGALAPATPGGSTLGRRVAVLPGQSVQTANHSQNGSKLQPRDDSAPDAGTDDGSDAGAAAADDAGPAPLAGPDAVQWQAYMRRVQHALNDGAPLPIAWLVVFPDADTTGHFHKNLPQTTSDQAGWHETLITDYQVTNVPGFGTLQVGVSATDDQKAASLQDPSTVTFLRVKNSWGTAPSTGWAEPLAGYNDLDVDYLSETIQLCDTNGQCAVAAPGVFDIVLPPGY
ncbi:MAG: hypothetical protein ABI461_13490 [Polyangiaceae bacterium]